MIPTKYYPKITVQFPQNLKFEYPNGKATTNKKVKDFKLKRHWKLSNRNLCN